MRVLIVEDYAPLRAAVAKALRESGYSVDEAADGEAGFWRASSEEYDLIVLDLMLPRLDGLEVLRRLRGEGRDAHVLILTARDRVEDRVQGLDLGADDYLVKPFELDELLARVRSLIRRARWDRQRAGVVGNSQVLRFGDASVDFATCEASMAGSAVHLTRLELDLMRYFADNPGRVLSRKELLEQVWHLRNYPNTRTVDNFVARLRKHFEPQPRRPVFILSVRGAGYRFVPG